LMGGCLVGRTRASSGCSTTIAIVGAVVPHPVPVPQSACVESVGLMVSHPPTIPDGDENGDTGCISVMVMKTEQLERMNDLQSRVRKLYGGDARNASLPMKQLSRS
jgi:hypothetical protein